MKANFSLNYLLILALFGLVACSTTLTQSPAQPTEVLTPEEAGGQTQPGQNLLAGSQPVEIERAVEVPALPFPDNPDPALCGIPQAWNNDELAYLTGFYEGELIQPIVFLYDSHLRRKITAQAPHGSEIKILLSQSNPQLDYYLVKIVGALPPNEGWVPAPFVSFEKPPAL